MILIDTSAWSRAVRWKEGPDRVLARELIARLLTEDLVYIPAIALQELLSGLRHASQRERIHADMARFPALVADLDDHIRAADLVTRCAAVQFNAGGIDALIAAQAIRHEARLLTYDGGFVHMARADAALELIAHPGLRPLP